MMIDILYLYLLSYSTYISVWLNFGSFYSSISLNLLLIISADFILYINIFLLIVSFWYYKLNRLLNYNKFITKILKLLIFNLWTTVALLVISIKIIFQLLNNNSLNLWTNIYIFNGDFRFSICTQIIKLILSILSLIICYNLFLLSPDSKNILTIEIIILINLLFIIGFNLISVNNFVLFILFLEGFSIILYILSTTYYTYGSIIASIKYFIFGTLGSIFLLWGVISLYRIFPVLSYNHITFISKFIYEFPFEFKTLINLVNFSSQLITLGFLFKLGVVPFHGWIADVYAGIDYKVLLIFTTFTKFIFFILYIRISLILITDIILDISIILSLIFGCIMTVRQIEIKRFLAYSSIVHTAFLLMGDLLSSILYLITYVLAILVFISVLIYNTKNLLNKFIYLKDLTKLRSDGLFSSVLILISISSLAVLPPFAGFFGKFYIWMSLIEDIYLFNNFSTYLFLYISIVLSLVIIYYYIRIIIYIFITKDIKQQYSPLLGFGVYNKYMKNFNKNPNDGIFYFLLVYYIIILKNKSLLLVQLLISFILVFWLSLHAHIIKFILFFCLNLG